MNTQVGSTEPCAFRGKFEADVPAELQEDVLQRIVELAWSGQRNGDGISIIDLEQLNQLNIEFSGSIEIEGAEHSFHIRDGNNNGTEVISWNAEAGLEIERSPGRIRALVPRGSQARDAIHSGRAAEFLSRWNRDLNPDTERGRILHDLPSKEAYDAWATGSTPRIFGQIAEKHGYLIGDREEELDQRRLLHLSELRLAPNGIWPPALPEVRQVYEAWRQAYDPKSAIGNPVNALRDRVASRLAEGRGLSVTIEEDRELAGHGFKFVRPADEMRFWAVGLAPAFSPEPIEGFDPATLPEDPVRSIFADFFRHTGENPNMDRRVNPVRACADLMSGAFVRMGREKLTTFPEGYEERLARYGYRLVDRFNDPEPVRPDADDAPSP